MKAEDFLTQNGRKALLGRAVSKLKDKAIEEVAKEKMDGNFGILSLYCSNLTNKAKEGKLDIVVGREREVQEIIESLCRRNKNNVLLVGESGVGKTSIANLLAQKIVAGEVPNSLKDVAILELLNTKLISGTRLRSDIEGRLTKILSAAEAMTDKCILFIDDLENILHEEAGESIAFIVKNSLQRSISTTCSDVYRTTFEKDASFNRRFQVMRIEASTEKETMKILEGLKEKYSSYYGVELSEDAIKAAVVMSQRFVSGRWLPEKAVDLVDSAASALKLELEADPGASNMMNVTHIAKVIEKWTGIPSNDMLKDEREKLLKMDSILDGKVIGQHRAVVAISNAVRRSKTGMSDERKPIGSFLFLGPTGVGKTELAKALAEFLFNNPDAMHRFDMSEYGEKHMVARMLGAPPGYAGHDQGGQLTDPIRNNPYSVILFDEIEKAHPDVWNIWLQILDEGRLTDSCQRVVDFRNTVIIMTSNIGSRHTLEDQPDEAIKDKVMAEVRKQFKPELLNRIDSLVVFNKLNSEGIRKITDLQLRSLIKRLENKKITLNVSEAARDWLAQIGYQPEFGARPLKRAIQVHLEDLLAEELMNGKFGSGDVITVEKDNGSDKLHFSKLD